MFNLGDKVKILSNDLTVGDIGLIDRVQYYNRGKVGVITHIENGDAMISVQDLTLNGKEYILNLPIRLTGLEKV